MMHDQFEVFSMQPYASHVSHAIIKFFSILDITSCLVVLTCMDIANMDASCKIDANAYVERCKRSNVAHGTLPARYER